MKHIRNRYYFAGDLALITLAAYLSFVLRLETFRLGAYGSAFGLFAACALFVVPAVFHVSGIYSRYWRYASVEELQLLARSVMLAVVVVSGLSLIGGWWLDRITPVPRSVPGIFFLITLIATAAPRLMIRLRTLHTLRRRSSDRPRAVLVMGAGEAGRMIVRELRQNQQLGMDVVGFLDDDVGKHGMHIHGVPVLGGRQKIATLAQQRAVAQVIVAMPTAPGKVIRDIKDMCTGAGVKIKMIPGIYELLDGTVSVNQLRDIQIEDLLRREPVQTDIGAVRDLVRGKRVLVTGGGGSIGSELCRQVLRCGPAEIIILGHGENSVFAIENELRALVAERANETESATAITAMIADIRFPNRLHAIFQDRCPEIVFHAAAHKHVPLMELNVVEAITNNVLGTRNLLGAALATDVERFVMISTDKAVNPTNVMGASKRIAELLVHHAAEASGKPYVAVRFGNVLGSRGSVLHTFKQQIASGGPIRVTHPKMSRYFMTIPEAVQLVLQAAVLGHGKEVFVLDMGKPVKIVDLARDMIELSGLQVGRDIDITFTGLRPGEKLFEELFVRGEIYQRTCHQKIFVAENASNFVPSSLHTTIRVLAAAAERNDTPAILRGMQALVPEFEFSPNHMRVLEQNEHLEGMLDASREPAYLLS